MEDLVEFLKNMKLSISSVESFTVGTFASELGKVPGVSAVYKGSIVSYQNCIKEKVLKIPSNVIETFGVVSKEVAGLMAIHGKDILDTDICVSFTGNAGPDAMEGKPVGLIYIGIAIHDHISINEYELSGSREDIKQQAISLAIKKILDLLRN